MKKLVIFSLIAVMAAGAAFAQVADGLALGVWGRVGFVPLEMQLWKDGDDDRNKAEDLTASVGQTWGGSFGRNVRLQFSGSNDFVGFNTWIQTDGGSVSFGDYAGIWAKPFDFLKVDLGKFVEDTLRGKIDDTDFHAYTLNVAGGADQIFTRFGYAGVPGALVSLTPVEGLFIGVGLPELPGWDGSAVQQSGIFSSTYDADVPLDLNGDGDSTNDSISIPVSGKEYAKGVYEKIQAGAGYQIEGIGHFRAQYVGANEFSVTKKTFKRAEVAFALSAIEGMTLDIGVKIPFAEEVNNITYSDPFTASAGFNMGFGDIGLWARIDTFFGGGEKHENSASNKTKSAKVNLHLVPTYNLGFATLGLEAGMEISGKSKSGDTEEDDDYFDFGIGLWAMKALGENGLIKAGVSYTGIDLRDKNSGVNGFFRIPIVAEVFF